jgi:hypothetical protein
VRRAQVEKARIGRNPERLFPQAIEVQKHIPDSGDPWFRRLRFAIVIQRLLATRAHDTPGGFCS